MKGNWFKVSVGEVANGFVESEDNFSVVGFGGKLNIRPKYQREMVYKEKQRDAVIDTIVNNLPLSLFYWAKNDDGTYEVLDGQQRTISFCRYVNNDFSINARYFRNLTDEEQKAILDYELLVYVCEGSTKERLDWFRKINIAGEELTEQELLNINYTGSWLESAKKYFAKPMCVAMKIGDKYVKGSPIRQEYLETALSWISGGKENIPTYMAEHQHDADASRLWIHFNNVISWVNTIFPNYRKEMKGIDWGRLYAEYKDNNYNIAELENKVSQLMSDDEITSRKNVFEYVLSGCSAEKERLLSLRSFTDAMKRTMYERQNGICPHCGQRFSIDEMQGEHIIEWSKGGRTILENGEMVCHKCHKTLTKTIYD